MKSFDGRTYSVSDFSEWSANDQLVLSPKFQRRAVWSRQAKSYLIDTVLRGKPMPKVLINQELVDGKQIRTVIDGQQRLRAVLEFLADGFTVSRSHSHEFGGLTFSQLTDEAQRGFLQYEISVDVLFDMSLAELLDIFSRLNTYSVTLNSTEMFNAKYVGDFKLAAHELGHKYAAFLLDARVVTEGQLARMKDVELAGDLLNSLLNGVQSRKSLERAYREFDEDSNGRVAHAQTIFERTMALLAEIYEPADLAATNFNREYLFYSLFLALSGMAFGAPEFQFTPDPPPSAAQLRVRLDDFSQAVDAWTARQKTPGLPMLPEWTEFLRASKLRTTDHGERRTRSDFILRAMAQ